jgi:hypothetical protein
MFVMVQARTNRTAPLLASSNAPYFDSIACATRDMTARMSLLLYFVVEEVLSLPVPDAACVA